MTDKISISKLIFPIFVPHLLLRAFKSLYFSGKNNSLTTISGTQAVKTLVTEHNRVIHPLSIDILKVLRVIVRISPIFVNFAT